MDSFRQHRVRGYLTLRQKQCVRLLAEGKTAAAIAYELGLSTRMVRAHLFNAKQRLGAISLPQMVLIAEKMGLLEDRTN
jgi:DNA-binding CsgD family transcriptional regulator